MCSVSVGGRQASELLISRILSSSISKMNRASLFLIRPGNAEEGISKEHAAAAGFQNQPEREKQVESASTVGLLYL